MVTEDQLFGDLRAGKVRLGRFDNVQYGNALRDLSSEDNTVKTFFRGPLLKVQTLNPLGGLQFRGLPFLGRGDLFF